MTDLMQSSPRKVQAAHAVSWMFSFVQGRTRRHTSPSISASWILRACISDSTGEDPAATKSINENRGAVPLVPLEELNKHSLGVKPCEILSMRCPELWVSMGCAAMLMPSSALPSPAVDTLPHSWAESIDVVHELLSVIVIVVHHGSKCTPNATVQYACKKPPHERA